MQVEIGRAAGYPNGALEQNRRLCKRGFNPVNPRYLRLGYERPTRPFSVAKQ